MLLKACVEVYATTLSHFLVSARLETINRPLLRMPTTAGPTAPLQSGNQCHSVKNCGLTWKPMGCRLAQFGSSFLNSCTTSHFHLLKLADRGKEGWRRDGTTQRTTGQEGTHDTRCQRSTKRRLLRLFMPNFVGMLSNIGGYIARGNCTRGNVAQVWRCCPLLQDPHHPFQFHRFSLPPVSTLTSA